jgi:serine/threonine-protein kinase
VTPELERVIMRCVEDDRDKRYQSVTDLREALEDALHLSDTSIVRTQVPVRSTPAAINASVLGLGAAGAVWDAPTVVLPRDAVSAGGADSADSAGGASAGRASPVSSTSTRTSALPTPTGSPRPSDPAAPGTSPSAGTSPTPVPTATLTPALPIMSVSPTTITLTTTTRLAVTQTQFTVANIGGTSLSWTALDNGGGFRLSPASGSIAAGGHETVTVSNILLSGSVTVSAPGAQNSPQTVTITCGV